MGLSYLQAEIPATPSAIIRACRPALVPLDDGSPIAAN